MARRRLWRSPGAQRRSWALPEASDDDFPLPCANRYPVVVATGQGVTPCAVSVLLACVDSEHNGLEPVKPFVDRLPDRVAGTTEAGSRAAPLGAATPNEAPTPLHCLSCPATADGCGRGARAPTSATLAARISRDSATFSAKAISALVLTGLRPWGTCVLDHGRRMCVPAGTRVFPLALIKRVAAT